MNERVTIPIHSAFDAITARAKVREFARETGLDVTGQARISLAAYSLANTTNLRSTSQCQLTVKVLKKGKRAGVEVACVIPNAANDHLTSDTFGNVKWLVDEFTVATLPSNETQIILIQWSLPPKGRFQ
ncbi:MAG: hypothetical protein JXA14_13445 [Anaerolineae bacterium]|nr:hypothetical protein [Anaerolineae bacterium]